VQVRRLPKKPVTIERVENGAAVWKLSQPIKAHCVQALEDVAAFSMLRRMAVLIDKPLDFLESRDDALVARRSTRFLPCLDQSDFDPGPKRRRPPHAFFYRASPQVMLRSCPSSRLSDGTICSQCCPNVPIAKRVAQRSWLRLSEVRL
jgi:hypothetical protein